MATPEFHQQPAESDPRYKNALEQLTPPPNGGVFLSKENSLPALTHDVSVVETSSEIYGDRIVRKFAGYSEDGFAYKVVGIRPKKLATTTPIIRTTPWFTPTEGYNSHIAHALASNGFGVILVGPEGEIHHPGKNVFSEPLPDLAHTAYNINRIADHIAPIMGLRPDEAISDGASRGAMTQKGYDIKAYTGDRTFVFRNMTAPCNPDPCSVEEYTEILSQIPHEPLALVKALGHLAFRRAAIHYPATIKANPSFVIACLKIAPTLFNGRAGEMAAAGSHDVPTHRLFFDGDKASRPDRWSEIQPDSEHIHTKIVKGNHLSIPKPEVLAYTAARLHTLVEGHGPNESLRDADLQKAFRAKPSKEFKQKILDSLEEAAE